MANFVITTHNPIARAGIVRTLMVKGYKLYQTYTISEYFTRWPAQTHPMVIATNEGFIDLNKKSEFYYTDAIDVSINDLESIPNFGGSVNPSVFPKSAKYSITYKKQDGVESTYTISNPIESTDDSITAYAFQRGIRTFKKARIRSFSKIN